MAAWDQSLDHKLHSFCFYIPGIMTHVLYLFSCTAVGCLICSQKRIKTNEWQIKFLKFSFSALFSNLENIFANITLSNLQYIFCPFCRWASLLSHKTLTAVSHNNGPKSGSKLAGNYCNFPSWKKQAKPSTNSKHVCVKTPKLLFFHSRPLFPTLTLHTTYLHYTSCFSEATYNVIV